MNELTNKEKVGESTQFKGATNTIALMKRPIDFPSFLDRRATLIVHKRKQQQQRELTITIRRDQKKGRWFD